MRQTPYHRAFLSTAHTCCIAALRHFRFRFFSCYRFSFRKEFTFQEPTCFKAFHFPMLGNGQIFDMGGSNIIYRSFLPIIFIKSGQTYCMQI